MTDPIRELKVRAELLHHHVQRGHPRALARLRSLPQLRADAEHERARAGIRRRHCLSVVAREYGFSGWPHARAVLSGAPGVSDFGTLLYPDRCGAFLNLWYREYQDARTGHEAAGGYLLAYRRDFLVVGRCFIETLGLDPDAGEWRRLAHDWVRPPDVRARASLYGELLARGPREDR